MPLQQLGNLSGLTRFYHPWLDGSSVSPGPWWHILTSQHTAKDANCVLSRFDERGSTHHEPPPP